MLARMTAASELAPDGDFDRRLAALRAQIDALSEGLDTYLDELVLGRRRFLPYEHLKLYLSRKPEASELSGLGLAFQTLADKRYRAVHNLGPVLGN